MIMPSNLDIHHMMADTEGPWELLKHYNVAAVMTDSPDPSLRYLSNVAITAADRAFIRPTCCKNMYFLVWGGRRKLRGMICQLINNIAQYYNHEHFRQR
jgi:hypothetical protein